MNLINYMIENHSQIISLLIEHIKLTAISVSLAIAIGIPIGIIISYIKKLNKPIMGLANVMQAIPSMALLGFMVPILGIGTVPAITTVVLYSLLPIVKNTYTGIDNINPQTIEAATGIGLTKFQILTKVQIPLALPVIMAGVRISSVTSVGLMTIAAFIGAGGLGFLVFSGIQTVNNYQILSGAIPACILALSVDAFASLIEKLVTPISLQKSDSFKNPKKRNAAKIVVVSVFLVILSAIGGNLLKSRPSSKSITISGKNFTEQNVVACIIADFIEERTDIRVDKKLNLGGTQVCFSALKQGDIDLYVEYTGTAYGDTLKHKPISDVQKVYDTVKKEFKELHNIEVLEQLKFNNTYALAVTKETSEKYNMKSISDLAKVAHTMESGTGFEFLNRGDGLPGLKQKYKFEFKNSLALVGAPKYLALTNKKVDVIDVFATDGLLKKFNLVVLKDNKSFFPPYFAIPIMRSETLKKYPEIREVLKEIGTYLNDDVMAELNYQVDELQKSPEEVAKEFLEKQGLIK